MKHWIAAYVLRYGLENFLTEVGEGLMYAEQEHTLTPGGKKNLVKTAESIFRMRNEVANADLS